ncbi:hypothetical protein GCM10027051_23940 [Niabella terrae]
MYSKAEVSHIKKEFWTSFGRYMKPVPNAEGQTINWINYKTGIRHIYFRMDVDKRIARVAIELNHPLKSERQDCLKQFRSMQSFFESFAGTDWNWLESVYEQDGSELTRIFKELEGVSIFDRTSWPEIISFLKEQIINLDAFWAEVKPAFER